MALTKLKVDGITERGLYGDGDGLWLQVSRWGTKAWLYRYMRDGRSRHMGLGSARLVSLAEARDRADAARRLLRNGTDPIEQRRAEQNRERVSAAAAMTFRQAAAAAIAAREAGWTNAEHRRQWQATLEQYAFPTLGNLPVSAVDTVHVVKVLEPIWNAKRVTGERVRSRIEAVLSWATAVNARTGDNPARWRNHLEHTLSKDKPDAVHHAAVPFDDLPAFMRDLRARQSMTARALEFVILTATRTGEAIAARWDEIEGTTWTVPAARMKGMKGRRSEHRVPLSDAAMAVLRNVPRTGEFVFSGARPGRHLHKKAMDGLLKGMGVTATVHGMRACFRTWAAERTNYPREVCEQALAHAIPDAVERSYRRGDLYAKRARLMDDWSKFCASPVTSKNNVIAIRRSKR